MESAATMDRAHGDLLALDPSVASLGVALFRHGVLIACGRVRPVEEAAELGHSARCLRVAEEVVSWWIENRGEGKPVVRTVIFEWPQIYRATKSKGDPNKLIDLAGVGQSLAVLLTCVNVANGDRPPELLSPTPREWTGTLPKNTKPGKARKSPRGIRIFSNLKPGEIQIVPNQHDAIDGLGLGLYALGRYSPHHVYSGCT